METLSVEKSVNVVEISCMNTTFPLNERFQHGGEIRANFPEALTLA